MATHCRRWLLRLHLCSGGRSFRGSPGPTQQLQAIYQRADLATALGERVPLIRFPQRRTPDGKPLVTLSPELLQRQHVDIPSRPAGMGQEMVDLPANYGRKPLTEEEIEAINLGGAR